MTGAGVPTPRGWPLIGHLVSVRRDVLGFLERSHARHGDHFLVRIGRVPIHAVASPALARHVLVDRRDNYEKTSRSSAEIRHIAGASLLTANGDDWHRRRQALQPAFRPAVTARYHEVMAQASQTAIAAWRRAHPNGGVIDLGHEMMRLTFQIVGQALLGEDLHGSAAVVDRSMRLMLGHVAARLQSVALPITWPTPANRRFHAARARLHTLVDGVIARRRAEDRPALDLLDAMIAAATADDGLDAAWLRDEVATLLLSGHETTAHALTWTCHLLASRPDVQDRVRDELTAHPDPTAHPYLRQVVFESMRLYPPVWLIERRAREADVLGDVDVPAGANIAIVVWLLHRHPEYWSDPVRFDPGRFADAQLHGRPGPHYLPFGLGPRTCMGASFALHEALIVLSRVLAAARLTPVPASDPVAPEAGVTLRPKRPLQMQLTWVG